MGRVRKVIPTSFHAIPCRLSLLFVPSTGDEPAETGEKLRAFQEAFVEAHHEFIAPKVASKNTSGVTENIDSVFGDCSDILLRLIDVTSR